MSRKKPRQKKLDPKKIHIGEPSGKKKERDWTFEDILRSKPHKR